MVLAEVKVEGKSFQDYRKFNPQLFEEVSRLAGGLKGKRVLHINATPVGGGVAEMLKTQVALERDLGIDSTWLVLTNLSSEFFEVTKKVHNLLQGKEGNLSEKEKDLYLKQNEKIGEELEEVLNLKKIDTLVVHDPQPLAAIEFFIKDVPCLLRVHIDLSQTNGKALGFFKEAILKYDKVVLSKEDYRPSWLPKDKTQISYPAIDPLLPKNTTLPKKKVEDILSKFSIDPQKPLVTQVSRFDPWKDPLGVIEAYKKAKEEIPDLQLVLAGFIEAQDDPEAVKILDQAKEAARGEEDIFLFSNLEVLGQVPHDVFINALQSGSDVVLQKSLREGFGLTVTEAMWKGAAVIGGEVGGITLQITHGENGFLVNSPEEAAKFIVKLIKDPKLREKVGKKARQSVKERFLVHRLLEDFFELYEILT